MEDDEALRGLLGLYLSRVGCQPAVAATASEATALFAASPESFSAAVIDVTLPDTPGDQLVEPLRSLRPGLPVLLISGKPVAVNGEAIRFLQKPFGAPQLLQILRGLIENPSEV